MQLFSRFGRYLNSVASYCSTNLLLHHICMLWQTVYVYHILTHITGGSSSSSSSSAQTAVASTRNANQVMRSSANISNNNSSNMPSGHSGVAPRNSTGNSMISGESHVEVSYLPLHKCYRCDSSHMRVCTQQISCMQRAD
jgi:hypothetical protein